MTLQPRVSSNINVLQTLPPPDSYENVIDAIFGFSFSGGNIRPPFDTMIEQLITDSKSKLVLSVDVPSGWPIEEEKCQDNLNDLWQPRGLISL